MYGIRIEFANRPVVAGDNFSYLLFDQVSELPFFVKITNHGKSQADLKELVLLAELRHCWHLTEPARHPTHLDHGRIFHQQINDLQQHRNIMQHRKCSNEMNKCARLKIE